MSEEKKMIDMTREEYDKFMCEKFPELFQDRNKPMSQTCMCWGFDIDCGWYELLYNLCVKLDFIREQTGLVTVFDQIKEKFGGGRFYYHINTEGCTLEDRISKLWCDFISNSVSTAEYESDRTCGTCGEKYYHGKISLGGWVYDACENCLISGKRSTMVKDVANVLKDRKSLKECCEKIKWKLDCMDSENLAKIESVVEGLVADIKAKREVEREARLQAIKEKQESK